MINTKFDKDYIDKLKEYLVEYGIFSETKENFTVLPKYYYDTISEDVIQYAEDVGIYIIAGPVIIEENCGETYWDCGGVE